MSCEISSTRRKIGKRSKETNNAQEHWAVSNPYTKCKVGEWVPELLGLHKVVGEGHLSQTPFRYQCTGHRKNECLHWVQHVTGMDETKKKAFVYTNLKKTKPIKMLKIYIFRQIREVPGPTRT